MSKGSTTRLIDLTEKIGSGATPRGGERSYKDNGIPLVRSMNVYDLRFEREGLAFLDVKQARELDHVTVKVGDVLINITGASVARCCIAPPDLAGARVNQHVAIIRPKAGVLDGRFLSYMLVSHECKAHLLNLARVGGTREALTKGGLERFQITVPSIQQQRRIASILGAYDDLIEVNRRRIALLEEMARRLFEEWFVRFRFPGHDGCAIIQTSDGPRPKEWSYVGLHDVSEVTYGFPFKSSRFNSDQLGVPVIRIRDIPNGKSQTWTDENFDARYAVKNGDLLIGMDGIFHTTIWSGGDAALNQRVTRLRPLKDRSVGWLLLSVLPKIKHLEATISGTTVAHLSARDLKSMRVLIPDDQTQSIADKNLRANYDAILNYRLQQNTLAASRDLLLPPLISGALSIAGAEQELEAVA